MDWRFEEGEIRGKKLVTETTGELDLEELDPETLAPKAGEISPESIVEAGELNIQHPTSNIPNLEKPGTAI